MSQVFGRGEHQPHPTSSRFRSFSPEPSWLVWYRQAYSGLGAGIVMESITPTENLPDLRSGVKGFKKRYRDLRQLRGVTFVICRSLSAFLV